MAKAFIRLGSETFRYNLRHILKYEVVQVNDGLGAFVSGQINMTILDPSDPTGVSVETFGPFLVADLLVFESYLKQLEEVEI